MLDLLAPQVGLEPTTLRLTVENSAHSALPRIALCSPFSMGCRHREILPDCGYYPEFRTFLKEYTHKNTHIFHRRFWSAKLNIRFGDCRSEARTDPVRLRDRFRLPSAYSQSFTARNRSAFVITETELKLMAAAAIMGFKSKPKNGNRTPAAIGTPIAL